MSGQTDRVCGVDKALVEQYLLLIRNNYRKAEKATYFLEQRTGLVNFVGVANMRDALSHLVTLLDENTPDNQRQAQLISAEEHLRRAILEPYNISVNRLTVKFKEVYANYRQRVLPVQDKYPILLGSPNDVAIRSSLREISDLVSKGRAAKAKNLWDPGWEQGVASLVEAFDKLSELYSQLEGYWFKYEHMKRERKQTWLTWWSLVATLLSLVIPLLLVLQPDLVKQARHYLHLE
ncbi:MAG: hypothetical protein WB729_16615 [Candidatus Sulfotelmatobacter sp.]